MRSRLFLSGVASLCGAIAFASSGGCGGADTDSSVGSTDSTSSGGSTGTVCEDYAEAMDALRERCLGDLDVDIAAIRQMCLDALALPDTTMTEARFSSCIASTQDQCTIPDECMLDAPGVRADGEPCVSSLQCASGRCSEGGEGCGECVAGAGLGEACSYGDCAEGLICGSASSTCVAEVAGVGEPCDPHRGGCVAGSYCAHDRGDVCVPTLSASATCYDGVEDDDRDPFDVQRSCGPDSYCAIQVSDGVDRGVCASQLGTGAPCTGYYSCAEGLSCVEVGEGDARCAPPGEKGDPCGMSSDCVVGLLCGDSTCTDVPPKLGEACTDRCEEGSYCDAGGSCVARRAVGATCETLDMAYSQVGECQEGLRCVPTDATREEQICAKARRAGEACELGWQCASLACDGGACKKSDLFAGCTKDSDCAAGSCESGYCAPLVAGQPCTSGEECASGACVGSGAQGKCAEPAGLGEDCAPDNLTVSVREQPRCGPFGNLVCVGGTCADGASACN